MKIKLGILLSGRGSNFRAIAEAIRGGQVNNATIALVVSNKSSAPGLLYAQQQGIPTAVVLPKQYEDLERYDGAVLTHLREAGVEMVILAGYMKRVSSVLLNAYPNRILNIHPSLLPAYGGAGMYGIKVHEEVLRQQEIQSGCSVHIVTEEMDQGPVLGCATVPVFPTDTPEELAARVLEQEHLLYPKIIQQFIESHFQEVP